MKVRFIQYLLPDGKEKEVWIDLPNITIAEVKAITDTGCIFTNEVLRTGQVAVYITYPDLGDYDLQIIDKTLIGKGIDRIIEEMIRSFDLDSFLEWKHNQE